MRWRACSSSTLSPAPETPRFICFRFEVGGTRFVIAVLAALAKGAVRRGDLLRRGDRLEGGGRPKPAAVPADGALLAPRASGALPRSQSGVRPGRHPAGSEIEDLRWPRRAGSSSCSPEGAPAGHPRVGEGAPRPRLYAQDAGGAFEAAGVRAVGPRWRECASG
jgi:hypothetical protein